MGMGRKSPVECMRPPPIENNSSPGGHSGDDGQILFVIELDPAHVDLAVKRWQAFAGEDARLGQSGLSFDEWPQSERSLRPDGTPCPQARSGLARRQTRSEYRQTHAALLFRSEQSALGT